MIATVFIAAAAFAGNAPMDRYFPLSEQHASMDRIELKVNEIQGQLYKQDKTLEEILKLLKYAYLDDLNRDEEEFQS